MPASAGGRWAGHRSAFVWVASPDYGRACHASVASYATRMTSRGFEIVDEAFAAEMDDLDAFLSA